MKKLIVLFFVIHPYMYPMENENEIPQEPWKIKKTIQHDMLIKSAQYHDLTKQFSILDQEKVTLIPLDDKKKSKQLPHFAAWKPPFDATGQLILTNPNNEIIILSNAKGKEIATINNSSEGPQKIVQFNNFADQILTVGKNVQLKNVNGTLITNCNLEPDYKPKIAKFFPDDDRLIFLAPHVYCYHPKAKLWDVRNKNVITYDDIDSLEQASIHPEGIYLTGIRSLYREVAYVYDLRKKGYTYLANFYNPRSVKFNKKGDYILSTKYYNASFALLWNMQAIVRCIETRETPEFQVKFFPANLSHAKFHPAGNRILTCSTATNFNPENGILIWDLAGNNRETNLLFKDKVYSAKYDKTGNYILTTHPNNIVTLLKKALL